MADWSFTPLTWDGTSLDQPTKWKAYFEFPEDFMRMFRRVAKEVRIPGDYAFPQSPGFDMTSRRGRLTVELRSQTQDNFDELKRVFRKTKGFVTMTISNGIGTFNLTVAAEDFETPEASKVYVPIYTYKPVLESNEISDSLRTFSASPGTWQLSPVVRGVEITYPKFEVEGDVAKSDANDYTRRWQISIANRSEEPLEDSIGMEYPIDIVDGALDTAAEVAAGRMLASCNDLRVILNGAEIPRSVTNPNSAASGVWCQIKFAPGRTSNLGLAIASAGSPANGGEIELDELVVGWDEIDRGSVLINNERIWFGLKGLTADGRTKLMNIKRGYANTTAAAHAETARVDWVEHDIQIVSDYSGASAPSGPTFAINTGSSTNLAHVYNGRFATPLNHLCGGMKMRYTPDNVIASLLSYREVVASANAIFGDVPPGSLVASTICHPFNNLELYVPCGVKSGGANLAFDVTNVVGGGAAAAGADIALNARIFGVDFDSGVETLLQTYKKADRGTGKSITPGAVLRSLRFNALYTAITGAYTTAAATIDEALGTSTAENIAQRFTLDQEAAIVTVALWMKENTAGDTHNIGLQIQGNPSSTAPEPSDTMVVCPSIPNSQLATTYGWVYSDVNSGNPVRLKGAQYDILQIATGGAGTIITARFSGIYSKGEAWDETGGVWTKQPRYDQGFLVIGDGSVVQPEAPTGMGGGFALDNITVTFDNTTPRTPKIVRSAQENIYIHRYTISNDDTGQSLEVFYVGAVGEVITIDCERKQVIIDDTAGIYDDDAVTPSDPERWLHLRGEALAAANDLRVVEAGMGTLKIQTRWKDRWG